MTAQEQIARSLQAVAGLGRELTVKEVAHRLDVSVETVYALRQGTVDGTKHLPALLAIPQFAEHFLAEGFGYAITVPEPGEVHLEVAFAEVHMTTGTIGEITRDGRVDCSERRRFRDRALTMIRHVLAAIRRKRARA